MFGEGRVCEFGMCEVGGVGGFGGYGVVDGVRGDVFFVVLL